MAASTADRYDIKSADVLMYISRKVAAATLIYKGIIVANNGSGYVVAGSDTAGLKVLGISDQQVDNSGGIAGAKSVEIQPFETHRFIEVDAVSPDDSWLENLAYLSDDHTVAITGVSNSIVLGTVKVIVKTGTAGRVLVDTWKRA